MKRLFLLATLAMLMAALAEANWQATGNLPCAKMRTEGDGTWNPQFILSNGCGDVVFWVTCINYPSKVDNEYYEGALQPGDEAWVETYPEAGEQFGANVHFQTRLCKNVGETGRRGIVVQFPDGTIFYAIDLIDCKNLVNG